jgi:hypothetical protein
MASEVIATLQSEIEAKQREVQRLAEEDEKNNIPSLTVAIEEVFRTQEAVDCACGDTLIPISPFCVLDKAMLSMNSLIKRNGYAVHHTGNLLGAALTAKYTMYKSLLNNAREDMDWKQANSDVVGLLNLDVSNLQSRLELLNLNVSNLQSRLDTIDAEKLNEHSKFKLWKFRMICAFLGAATAWIVHYCLEYPRNDSTVLKMT